MRHPMTLTPGSPPAKRSSLISPLVTGALLATILAASPPAFAVDGCLVLLCFAAPNWRSVSQCVPPIRQVLRDLARGKPFPTCAAAGSANTATHRWAVVPDHCPPQYTRIIAVESGVQYACDYTGSVSVNIEGALWARTWWNMGGDTVTEYTPIARSRLGTWDTRFDDDYAAWQAMLVPSAPACSSC